jgi:glycosyltransferase involved in cell wall biosynthesis
MTIGYHAPLPPARTGVADYAAALLAELQRHAQVRVNSPGDVDLYQLGNNQLHREIYQRAIAKPGIALLHDAVLQHFFLGWLDERAYVKEFVYNYGAWHADLARDLHRSRARSAQDPRYFDYPMLRRVAEASRAAVVHNPAAAAMVRAHAPQAVIHEIPHLYHAPGAVSPAEAMRYRQRLGVAPEAALFGVFGHLRESKRLMPVLEVFARVHRAEPRTALVVAGEFASTDLERAARDLLAQPGVFRLGYLSGGDFWKCASAVDACVNLRHPSAGEASGITIRLMGLGRAVIVTQGAENSRYPADACLRVDAGAAEQEMLAAYMLWLARDPCARREIGRRAADYIAAEHDAGKVARRFLDVLRLY